MRTESGAAGGGRAVVMDGNDAAEPTARHGKYRREFSASSQRKAAQEAADYFAFMLIGGSQYARDPDVRNAAHLYFLATRDNPNRGAALVRELRRAADRALEGCSARYRERLLAALEENRAGWERGEEETGG